MTFKCPENNEDNELIDCEYVCMGKGCNFLKTCKVYQLCKNGTGI